VLQHVQGSVIDFTELLKRIDNGAVRALYVASDAIDPWIDEATASRIRQNVAYLVVQDTTVTPLAQTADVVLAAATFAEKAGTYVNAEGRLQYAEAALPPRDGALPDLDILTILSGPGPADSGEVLAEVAAAIPAFAAVAGGRVPPFGIKLGDTSAALVETARFSDPWNERRAGS
jgi:predicted molibdopterin-dependent oxidoreductase YjgC